MINSILLPVYAGLLCYGVYDIKHDKEYRISLTSNEILSLMMAYITSSLLLLVVSLQTAIFLTAAMAFLHISAITDTKTHMITFGYIYLFVPIAIICESWQAGRFSCWTLLILIFAISGNIISAYKTGDILLIFLITEGFYLYSNNLIYSFVYIFFILLFAIILLLIEAFKSGNIKRFKLKNPMPLGGFLLISTYIVTLGYIIINSVKG